MNDTLTYKVVIWNGETHYTLNLNRKYYVRRKMLGFMKATSGTLTAFPFLHSRYIKKPRLKLLLFISSFSGNKSYSLKLKIIKWILQELISHFGLLTNSLLQLLV